MVDMIHRLVPITNDFHVDHHPKHVYCIHTHHTELNLEKPSLVILHGYLRQLHDYEYIMDHFQDDFNILAVDLRGHGDSEYPLDHEWSIEELSSDIFEVINHLSFQKTEIFLFGHSLSTAISIKLANDNPDIFKGLLLVSPTLKFDIPIWIKLLLNIASFIPNRLIDKLLKRGSELLPKVNNRIDPRLYEEKKEKFMDIDLDIHEQIFKEALLAWDGKIDNINASNMPVLIMASEDDTIISVDRSLEIHKLLTNSAIKLTNGTNHHILDKKPIFILLSMQEWFEEIGVIEKIHQQNT